MIGQKKPWVAPADFVALTHHYHRYCQHQTYRCCSYCYIEFFFFRIQEIKTELEIKEKEMEKREKERLEADKQSDEK